MRVVAFTAAQIPGIDDRVYPAALAGPQYPDGIPVRPEADLAALIAEHEVDEVLFAYSDLPHEQVMQHRCLNLASGIARQEKQGRPGKQPVRKRPSSKRWHWANHSTTHDRPRRRRGPGQKASA